MTEQVLLCRAELEEMIQLSRSQIYSLMKLGKFPQPLKLGEGLRAAVRWRKDEIEEWLAARPRANTTRPDLPEYQAGQAA